MFHALLHFAVPVVVAVALYRPDSVRASLVMLATMVVDLDHLLADPIYDPLRCSIDFHPLHSRIAVGIYTVVLVATVSLSGREMAHGPARAVKLGQWIAVGLLIHMALDGADCLI